MNVWTKISFHLVKVEMLSLDRWQPAGGATWKVRMIHPLGITNFCTKFQGNPSDSCRDTSVVVRLFFTTARDDFQCHKTQCVIILRWLTELNEQGFASHLASTSADPPGRISAEERGRKRKESRWADRHLPHLLDDNCFLCSHLGPRVISPLTGELIRGLMIGEMRLNNKKHYDLSLSLCPSQPVMIVMAGSCSISQSLPTLHT